MAEQLVDVLALLGARLHDDGHVATADAPGLAHQLPHVVNGNLPLLKADVALGADDDDGRAGGTAQTHHVAVDLLQAV